MELNQQLNGLGLEIGEPTNTAPVSTRRAIVVVGSHRSGTSALARVLNLVGCDLPKRIMPPLEGNNELGFWEPEALVNAHEAFLAQIGSSWDDVAAFPEGAFVSAAARELRQQLTILLREEYGSSPLFVVKDPRISRLLPLCFAALAELHVAPTTAIAVRNPLEVAASLKARDGFTTTKSLLLWLRHALESEHHSRGRPRSIVMYDELLRDWQTVLTRMEHDLALTWPGRSHRASVEVENFLSQRHRHHLFDWSDVEGRADVVSWVKEAYFALRASDPVPTLDQVREELARADTAFGPIVEEARLALHMARRQTLDATAARNELAAELEARDLALDARADEIKRLNTEVQQLTNAATESLSRAASHEAVSLTLRAERDDLANETALVSAEVRRLAAALEAAEDRIAAAQAEIGSRQEELNNARAEAGEFRVAAGEADSRAAALEADSSAERERLLARLEVARANIAQLEGQLRSANAALGAFRGRAAAERRELLRQIQDARTEVARLSSKVIAAEAQASAAQGRLLSKLHAADAESRRLAKRVEDKSLELEGLASASDELLSIAEAELDVAAREHARLQAEIVNSLEERGQLTTLVERLETSLETARAEVEPIKRQLEAVQAEAARERVTLLTERDAARSDGERIARELRGAREEAQQLADRLALLEEALDARTELVRALQSLTKRRALRRRTLSQLTTWLLPPTPRKLSHLKRYIALRWSGEFDSDSYLLTNLDVLASGMNPLMHYIEHGSREGRLLKPEPAEPTSGISPPQKPVTREPSTFSWLDLDRDEDEYSFVSPGETDDQPPSEEEEPRSPLIGLDSAVVEEFDAAFYRLRNPDVPGTDADLLTHYLTHGWKEHRDPSHWFSTAYYLAHNPDIREGGINPFTHYVTHGRAEGRLANAYKATKLLKGYRPTISAIVPAFNHAAYLRERIESIVAQDCPPTEIVILDDASTDGSRELIDQLRRDIDIPVVTAFNDRNSGNVFKQWRQGMSLSSGDLVWICESDDFCSDTFLSFLVPYFADQSITLAFGRIQFADENGVPGTWLDHYREAAAAGYWDAPRVDSAYAWFRGPFGRLNVIPNVGGCLFRRQEFPQRVWRAAQRYAVCGDWYLYMQIAGGGRIAYEPGAISYFRQHSSNTSVSSQAKLGYYREHARVASELRRRYGVEDGRLCELYRGAAEQYLRHFPTESKQSFNQIFDLQRLLDQECDTRHVLIGILGFRTGGAELFPINLANALVDQGYVVSLLVLDSSEEEPGVRGRLRPEIPVYERGLVQEIGLERFFADYGIDLVHTHYLGVDRWIHRACRDSGIPYVVTLHGSYEVGDLDSDTRASLLGSVTHWVYTADKNLSVFDGLPLDHGVFTKMANAVPEVKPGLRLAREEYGIPEDAFVFGIASRAIRAKGWDIAARALQTVSAHIDRPVYLALCGDGDDYDELLAEYGDSTGVRFLGHQTNIIAFYRMCDCCLLPTRFRGESFPFTLIESLLAGTPIISTDIGEIPSIINCDDVAAGIVLPLLGEDCDFVAALATAMLRMIKEQSQFARGAKRLAKKYSFKRLTAEYEEIYHAAAGWPVKSRGATN